MSIPVSLCVFVLFVCMYVCMFSRLMMSLSMAVLNSRDWSEIVWVPEILCFKNQPCNRLYAEKPWWNALVRL